MKPRVLIFADWYLPGFRAGGLVTAVFNLVESIGASYDLFIFTRDRDIADTDPSPNIHPDKMGFDWKRARLLVFRRIYRSVTFGGAFSRYRPTSFT